MLLPSNFGETFFDNFFDESFGKAYRTGNMMSMGVMNTDIQENEQGYLLTIDMPGVKKEDVKAELKEGYLNVQAVSGSDNEEKDSEGRYICRERHFGSYSRSFYVGEDVTQEDIKAKFEDGTLKLLVPKKEAKPQMEEKKYIMIEG